MRRGLGPGCRLCRGLAVFGVLGATVLAFVYFGSAGGSGGPVVPSVTEGGALVGSAKGVPSGSDSSRDSFRPADTALPPPETTSFPALPVTTSTQPALPTIMSPPTAAAATVITVESSSRACDVNVPGAHSDQTAAPKLVELAEDDPVSVAIAVSQRLYTCADRVIVAHPVDLYSATVAAQLAVLGAGPLLYYLPSSSLEVALTTELSRLAPAQVWLMTGMPDSLVPEGAEIVRLPSDAEDLMAWVEFNRPSVGTGRFPVSDHRSLHSLVMIGGGLGVVLAPFPWLSMQPSVGLVMGSSTRPLRSPRLWMVAPDRPLSGLVVAVAASILGEGAIYWGPVESGGLDEAGQVLGEQVEGVEEVWIVGGMSETGRWLLETTLWGGELPGGGHVLFPHRRLVAFYGGVTTSRLGVLGEQGPAETADRIKPYLEDYAADGVMTVPTFEIITTLATGGAGRDGDYSGEFRIETLMPWIDYATQNDVYVVLDLQPGRSDFLSQAKQYEELLRLPNVGLALDPEWRLGPDEVHLARIGSVDAGEVNTVIDWLAELVRRERLPQKLLIVHQFRLDMITNRRMLDTPPELAVLIHMDGQGGQGAKTNTWNTLTRGTEDRGWWWGWKNFFDEDSPMADPQRVLDLEPVVYFVSYQ